MHGCEVLGVGARRDQRAAGVGEHRDRDRAHLRRRLARTVDDLRQAGAELAMRIDAREVEVADREPRDELTCFDRSDVAARNRVEERSESFGIHGAIS